MIFSLLFRARAQSRRPWVRVALFCLAAVLAALGASRLEPLIPLDAAASVGSEAVDELLSILASSMLPVATFSLTTMVQAYGSATSNVTPRAVQLLMQDSRAQTALATFIGAFVYSVVGIIALKTDYYGEQGRVVVFAVTLVVLALVVATLVRWIDTLSQLGRVGSTIDTIEAAARAALVRRAQRPFLGGRRWEEPRSEAYPVAATETGYVQHVDTRALDRFAERLDATIHVCVLPGGFVHGGFVLARITANGRDALNEAACADLRKAFVIGDRRSYDDDPRFGLIALSEVASRALSPAVNDPGTAIDVIGTMVRLFVVLQDARPQAPQEPDYARVYVQPLSLADLFDDAFTPIARDGAAIVEVGVRLAKAFAALSEHGDAEIAACAEAHAALALKRARATGMIEEDLAAIIASWPANEPSRRGVGASSAAEEGRA